jgi:UDP-N-acetylmuramoyl-tripeptide--D-alanyl-D-alanine ligase
MQPQRLSQLLAALGLTIPPEAEAQVTGISIDTRTLKPGDLFIAIPGPSFDGHNFVEAARNKGAIGALVEHHVESALPQWQVANSRLALGTIAAWYRSQFTLPVIAVTGSSGKTTTKEMIASILRQKGQVLASESSFNNEIGVPLTLLGLNDKFDFAVIELGANHPGEIAYTTALVQPRVAVVNNVGPAHIAGFGSLAGVAGAKSEIFSGLGPEGVAVINADDPFASEWRHTAASHQQLSFGMLEAADISGEIIDSTPEGCAKVLIQDTSGEIQVQLPLPGDHNAMNALAAAACARALDISLQEIKAGLSHVKGVAGRMQTVKHESGSRIIDDTYNANPGSVKAAIKYLANLNGIRILALGDMGELGEEASFYHRQIGVDAKRMGIDKLYTCGVLSAVTSEAFGDGATHFTEISDLIAALTPQLQKESTILVKGSRSARMERVVKALTE